MSIFQQKKFRVMLIFVLFNCNMDLPACTRIATRYNMYYRKLELNFVAGQEENNTNTQQTHTNTHTHKMSIVKYSTLY